VNPLIVEVALRWVEGIVWWMSHIHRIEWSIDSNVELSNSSWYLVVANHQSWVDIFALFYATKRKAPMLKFFIKKQLAWLPVVGQAWWALDFPFMARYSKEYLKKHPEKAGQDLEATRQACQKFADLPTSVVNFLEGTRFTPEKYHSQQSPFNRLLKPKAGGIAFAIQALGNKFNTIIDVTIHYEGKPPNYWDMACGRVGKVILHIRSLSIPEKFLAMDYTNNMNDKEEFQAWVHDIWVKKDKTLEYLSAGSMPSKNK